jgi:hypothetical protein
MQPPGASLPSLGNLPASMGTLHRSATALRRLAAQVMPDLSPRDPSTAVIQGWRAVQSTLKLTFHLDHSAGLINHICLNLYEDPCRKEIG